MANIVYQAGRIGLLNGLRNAMYEGGSNAWVRLLRTDGIVVAGQNFSVQIQFNAATPQSVQLTLSNNPEFDVVSAPVTVDRIDINNNMGLYVQIMLTNPVTFNNPGKFTLSSCTITI